ncbi:MAG: ROK family protein [Clostridiales bacterium]|nr:ROK family protein [Clostridiales bacterium]
MEHLGIRIDVINKPMLDKEFIPFAKFNRAFLETAKKHLTIAIKRSNDQVMVFDTLIHGTDTMEEADLYYIERLVKTLLWMKGGYDVTVCGDYNLYENIKKAYSHDGTRSFDYHFMSKVYEKPFIVNYCEYDDKPVAQETSRPLGRHLDGCRIGFDAGGSDRKVSAVIDGSPVFSEEVVWHPKVQSDPDYHYNEIVAALKSAAAYLPKVDAIGISSAGIYINNRTMAASLFLDVPQDLFEQKVKDIFTRAAKSVADVPVVVCNDGDVSALAGGMSLNKNSVLGIAMGTSEAAGFVDEHGNITGWLNELAFAPVDAQTQGAVDEWSGDIGCGVKYFSQDAVIRLAPLAGIHLDDKLTPAEKLVKVQDIMVGGPSIADSIFKTIGTYLGHTIALYNDLYKCKYVLLLGRVTSGRGGELIVKKAKKVLKNEYPEIAKILHVSLPDEKSRRIGQSVAAASLPKSRG